MVKRCARIRLRPTKQQEELFIKSAGVSRFSYNWALGKWNDYREKNGKNPSIYNIIREFNQLKKLDEYSWLNEVSAKTANTAMLDVDYAFTMFFKKASRHPKFKTRKNKKLSFYVRSDGLKIKDNKIWFERLGWIKFSTNYDLSKLGKFCDTRCKFDGKYWYLTLSYDLNEVAVNENQVEGLSIGIDLGIKNLAIVSNREKPYKNINKTIKVKKLEKKLKRLMRKQDRQFKLNNKYNEFNKTKNCIKTEREIKLVYRKLSNIRNNHTYQVINDILKSNPSRVVMEDLMINNLVKNRHLAKSIYDAKWGDFRRVITYKCEQQGIDLVFADRFFPSSKMCSCCGNVKKSLKLSDRTYHCDSCGETIDRDLNAAINLAMYNPVN